MGHEPGLLGPAVTRAANIQPLLTPYQYGDPAWRAALVTIPQDYHRDPHDRPGLPTERSSPPPIPRSPSLAEPPRRTRQHGSLADDPISLPVTLPALSPMPLGVLTILMALLSLIVALVAPSFGGSVLAASANADATAGATADALLATFEDPAIEESSGLAASRRQPGVLWTHNDSGDGPHLYASDRDGRALGTFAVPNASNTDWEDLAIGPGIDGPDALYIADTGDNARRRADVAIFRVPEPTVDLLAPPPPLGTLAETSPAERFPIAYPDGPHDVEALLLHPETGELLLVSKDSTGPVVVYRLPPLVEPDRPLLAMPVAEVSLPGAGPLAAATGGAVAPDGARFVLRTPIAAVEWTIGLKGRLADAIRAEPRRVALPPTPRGEAIAYRADGAALLLTTEGTPGRLYEQDHATGSAVVPLVTSNRTALVARWSDRPGDRVIAQTMYR